MNEEKEPAAGPLLYTISSAARRLGLARGTVTKLLDRGELHYRRILGGDRRIPEAELRRYAESELVGAERT
jgi:excisionase family DNA binding protein